MNPDLEPGDLVYCKTSAGGFIWTHVRAVVMQGDTIAYVLDYPEAAVPRDQLLSMDEYLALN